MSIRTKKTQNRIRVLSKKVTTLAILEKKCEYKRFPLPNMQSIEDSGKVPDLSSDWDEMLSHQISDLEPFEHYWEITYSA